MIGPGEKNNNNFIMKGLGAWELGDSYSNPIYVTSYIHNLQEVIYFFLTSVTSYVRAIWPGSATSLLFSSVQVYNSKQWGNGQVFQCERRTEDGYDRRLEGKNQFGSAADWM